MVINNDFGLQKLIAGSAIKGLDIKAIGQSLKEDRKFYCKCRTLMNWQGACVFLLPLKRNEKIMAQWQERLGSEYCQSNFGGLDMGLPTD